MSDKSTTAQAKSKAVKPYSDYPLTAHRNGSWCKKVRSDLYPKGKLIYFGPLADPQAALDLWLREKDELLAGHDPATVRARDRSVSTGLTVRDAIDRYLDAKEQHAEAGQITRLHLGDLIALGKWLAGELGASRTVESLRPEDFGALRAALSKRYGPAALLRRIVGIRSIFKFALESELIEKPVRYGPMFKLPTKKDLRLQRASKPEQLFTAAQVTRLIDAAGLQMKAMILLGINAGLGNSDCGNLQERHLDLEAGWLNYPRPKTGIDRRCKLWPETIDAITAAMAQRPKVKSDDHAGLVFVTRCGASWAKQKMDNPITKLFRRMLDSAGLHQEGLGFYTLRHVFETIGGGSLDQVTVDAVMGHVDESMASRYRSKIFDDRLEAVAAYVHQWLYAVVKPAAKPKAKRVSKPKAEGLHVDPAIRSGNLAVDPAIKAGGGVTVDRLGGGGVTV